MVVNNSDKIGLLYDESVRLHHTPNGHPENIERIVHAYDLLDATGLLPRLTRLSVQPATFDQIARVHSPAMLDRIVQMVKQGGGRLDLRDTYASPGSWIAATTAAGASINAVDAVMYGQVDSAFALVRPPGHHATPAKSMGFCLINNIALAAAHALAVHGLSRVLIVDFDVHHGNGTQDAFYEDSRVLFFSIHQDRAYPGTGAIDEIGAGPGTGATVNVPLPPLVGDMGYLRVFRDLLMPIAARYRPELILISAGYDAHWRNSAYVAGIQESMTVTGFGELSKIIKEIADTHCQGRMAAVLEGGYDLDSLGYGIAATLTAWLGDPDTADPVGEPPQPAVEPDLSKLIEAVRRIHRL